MPQGEEDRTKWQESSLALAAQEELPEGRPKLLNVLQAMAKVSMYEREREVIRPRETQPSRLQWSSGTN